MKKVFTIVMTMIILASGMQVSVDRHYCGGKLAGSKVSITGKLASCGMEKHEHNSSGQLSIDKKCCEDQLIYYSINSKYLPQYFRLSHQATGKDITPLPVFNIVFRSYGMPDLTSWVLPPGDKLQSRVSLSEICIYRI